MTERLRDVVEVWAPNGLVLAFVNLVSIKTCFEIVLISVSIGYTVWRWRRDARKEEHD